MNTVIRAKFEPLEGLCRQFHVARLELFGSAASGRFDDTRSDLDFLVTFEQPMTREEHADRYFGLLESLQDLFGRKIDLVEPGAIRNPYFREEVRATGVSLYEATGENVSV
jgi:predicted nucleotidyltransferase